MSSAAEAELRALFVSFQEAIPARNTLEEMGHKQPPTPKQTDNTTALYVVTNNLASKRLKSIDMRLHWLRFRENQFQLCHYWAPGPTNLSNCPTKHHAHIRHQKKRPTYLTPIKEIDLLRNKVLAEKSA